MGCECIARVGSLRNMTSVWLDDHEAAQTTDSLVAGTSYNAVVVGAGITGLTTALLLARAGLSVAVLEARFMGAVTTGNTTAKLSLLQGSVLSGIQKHFSNKVLRAYVEGNREGQDWMLRYLAERDVAVQRRDAYTYAGSEAGTGAVDSEFEACRSAGLDVARVSACGLPFSSFGAIRLLNQAQFNPMAVVSTLAQDIRSRGGIIAEGVRVHDVSTGARSTVSSQQGDVFADHVILATGTPILDRGLYFAKLEPSRSYAMAFRVPGAPGSIPQDMYVSIDSPTRSLRTAPIRGEELLLVGGNGHIVGRNADTKKNVDDLEAWTEEHFPGAERTHSWSAQDYKSANMVPFVGWLPRGRGKIFLATGYNKWGMTNSVAAALTLSADILGGHLPWSQTLHHRITGPADVATAATINANVGIQLTKGWLGAERSSLPAAVPAEGAGVVGSEQRRPVAISTVDGVTCALSAVCTHLGGIVTWNTAERSWDCPLHGSRFASDGTLLEGPAVRDLQAPNHD